MSHYIVISFICPTPPCLSAICHTVHMKMTQKLNSCYRINCVCVHVHVCAWLSSFCIPFCVCSTPLFSSAIKTRSHFVHSWRGVAICQRLWRSRLPSIQNVDLARGPLQPTHDLSGLETCLGNVCWTERVFMYVARHYRCILIRFSKPSQVCTPMKGKRLAGPPKQSNHTFAQKKKVWCAFFLFCGEFQNEAIDASPSSVDSLSDLKPINVALFFLTHPEPQWCHFAR